MVRPPGLRQTGLRVPRRAWVCAVAAAAARCGVTPLAAQNTVIVGSGRPAVEVNEEAIYFGLPGYNVPLQRYRSMPLYDPRNGRVLSRVLTLQPPSGAAPQLRPPMVGEAAPPLTPPRSRVVDLPPPRAAEKPRPPEPAPKAPVRVERKPAPPPPKPAPAPPPPKPAPAPPSTAAAKPPEPAPPPPKRAAPETAAAPPRPQPQPPSPPKTAAPAPRPPAEVAATTPATETPPPPRPASRPAAPVTAGQPMTVLFSPGDAQLSDEFAGALNQIADQIKDDERARLQLKAFAAGGSTSPSAARRLSLSRALAVRSFLIEAGLSSTKIDVRALGAKYESGPPDRVDVVVLN